MAKSNQEILEILKSLNGLPVEDVQEVLDSLDMTFVEWAIFTNQKFEPYSNSKASTDRTEEFYLRLFQGEMDISYEEFLQYSKLRGKYADITGLSNNAKQERAKRVAFLQGVPEEEKEDRVLTEEEVQTLEQIETEWNDVRAKYDPVKEVERATKYARDLLRFNEPLSQDSAVSLEEMKKCEKQLRTCFDCIGIKKEKNQGVIRVESELLDAMQEGIQVYETLQQFRDLELSEFYKFMGENGVAQADIEQHYKNRFTGMRPDSKPFIMARDGKGFRLNDNGELEVVDEQVAKNLIATDFYPASHTVSSIDKLEQGRTYRQLTESLPSKNLDRLTQMDIQELMDGDSREIQYWMMNNPRKVQSGLVASKILGKDIDWTKIQEQLIADLKDPGYFEDPLEEEAYISQVKEVLFVTGYDLIEVLARDEESTEEQEETPQADDLSTLSVEELMQRIESNNITIANNEQSIKQALIQKILGQQKQIAEQTAEIDRLNGQKEL